MSNKYEELTKLKELLDSGVLSQEEFDTAKKKLLEGDTQSSIPSTKSNSSSQRKWWYIGGAGVIACGIVALCLNTCGNRNEYAYYDSDSDTASTMTAYNQELGMSGFVEDGSEEDYEINNPWKKEFFHDEYGEDMPEHPFIRTYISGSWMLQIAYSNEMGFRFSLHDKDNELKHLYSPVSIIFRTAEKEEYFIEPDKVDNYCVYVSDPDNIRGIGNLLENGTFDIFMNYQMYNEEHQMVWKVNMSSGFFKKSVERML